MKFRILCLSLLFTGGSNFCIAQQKLKKQLQVPEIRRDSIELLPFKYWVCETGKGIKAIHNPLVYVHVLSSGEKYDAPLPLDYYADSLQKLLKYPEKAYDVGVQAKFDVGFRVDKLGAIDSIWTIKAPLNVFKMEVERAIKALPAFTPARQNSKLVSAMYLYEVRFQVGTQLVLYPDTE